MRSKPYIIILCVLAIGVGGLLLRDYLSRKRAFSERTACVGTLVRLRLAKMLYAEEHGLTNGALIPEDVVWRANGLVEHCHSGGKYTMNAVGVNPSCSHTGVVQFSGRLWRHTLEE